MASIKMMPNVVVISVGIIVFLSSSGFGWVHHCPQCPVYRTNPWKLATDFRDSYDNRFNRYSLFNNLMEDGLSNVFDEPWFNEMDFNLDLDDCHNNFNFENIKQWGEKKKEDWQKAHEKRKLAWEQKERQSKQTLMDSIEKEWISQQKQHSGFVQQKTDETNKVDINIVGSEISKSPSELVTIQISGYSPEEISVTTHGRNVQVTGKHSSGDCTKNNCISKEFKKTFVLPKQININTIKASVHGNGILKIEGQQATQADSNTLKPELSGLGESLNINEESTDSQKPHQNNGEETYHDEDVTIEVVEE